MIACLLISENEKHYSYLNLQKCRSLIEADQHDQVVTQCIT